MSDVAVTLEQDEVAATPSAIGDTFPELVWAHWKWERALHRHDSVPPGVEKRYRETLKAFEDKHGEILDSYWSTRKASAVAVTIKRSPRPLCWLGKDPELRFHQATDWVTKESPPIADAIQRCDAVAIRVSEILRGTSERVAMQWIQSIASRLLGYLDERDAPDDRARAVAEAQRRELTQVERYYERAGNNAARLVYFWGMMTGVLVLVLLAPAMLALLFFDNIDEVELRPLFACYAAGALGALVSVMSRMTKGSAFRLDFDVGRPALRRLGSFRPFLGAVFGVVTYFVLEAGIIPLQLPNEREKFFYYGALAFVAGFSERWTRVLLGAVGRQIPGDSGDEDRRQTVG